jgi:hypothetical protein
MKKWKTIGQAGFWGPDRHNIESELDLKYGGRENWRIIFVWGSKGGLVIPKAVAIELYGDAYYEFLKKNKTVREYIQKEARNVYVYEEQAVVRDKQSIPETLDYTIQEIGSTHLQDIAIRRAFIRLGNWFEGNKLICIRGGSDDEIGEMLSPGKVPFHLFEKIYEPHLAGWWEDNSVACFYHSNKLLQVKE